VAPVSDGHAVAPRRSGRSARRFSVIWPAGYAVMVMTASSAVSETCPRCTSHARRREKRGGFASVCGSIGEVGENGRAGMPCRPISSRASSQLPYPGCEVEKIAS
jgi:hypothetical protein